MEINVRDDSYEWFLHWMTRHQRQQLASSYQSDPPRTRSGVVESLFRKLVPGMHHLAIETHSVRHANGSILPHFSLVAGPGQHLIRYRGAFMLVRRERETKALDMQRGRPWETIKLTTLYAHRHLFEPLFQEAHQLASASTQGKMLVFTSRGTSWERFGEPRRPRPLDSVILDSGLAERLASDLRQFLDSAGWYHERGIPYRRGYLLHGPPGSGKSSFIQALAAHLDYGIAMLNLSERGLTDDRLTHLLSIVPARTVVLLEDADAAFGRRGRLPADDDGYRGAHVTFSGLLNALDGVASADERVLFLTTNHADRLDDALVRPGRVDLALRLGHASRDQVERLWDRFYRARDPHGDGRARFVARLEQLGVLSPDGRPAPGEEGVSMAALQGLFLFNKDDVAGAMALRGGLVRQGGGRVRSDGEAESGMETAPASVSSSATI